MRHLLPFLSLGAFLLPQTLPAQSLPDDFRTLPSSVDSGKLGNQGPLPLVVFRKVIRVSRAPWIRLFFSGESRLEKASQLRITSLEDGHVQFFEDWSLREWSYSSAYFNGDAVRVELLADSGTWANRMALSSLQVGLDSTLYGPNTICGPTDDRKPSSDPRAARQYPTGCTTWLIAPYAGITAGHCTSNPNQLMEFNVPPSSSTGSIRHPGPSDQYPYVSGSLRRLYGGVGKDWAVFLVVRNSITGLYPGEKQGSWFELGKVPGMPATIRITGYGVTYPRGTRSQTQQTHTGPMYALASTYLRYTTDTSGGNSGSPVIHEQTGKAVGIHTHGGCRSTYPFYGNYGTRIDRSDLQSAISLTLASRTVGSYVKFGTGCKGSAGIPILDWLTLPTIGRTFEIQASNLPANRAALLILGSSNTNWMGLKLPFSLAGLGMPGCSLLVGFDLGASFPTATGKVTLKLPLPLDARLVNAVFYHQLLVQDPPANTGGFTVSHGARGSIGKD